MSNRNFNVYAMYNLGGGWYVNAVNERDVILLNRGLKSFPLVLKKVSFDDYRGEVSLSLQTLGGLDKKFIFYDTNSSRFNRFLEEMNLRSIKELIDLENSAILEGIFSHTSLHWISAYSFNGRFNNKFKINRLKNFTESD